MGTDRQGRHLPRSTLRRYQTQREPEGRRGAGLHPARMQGAVTLLLAALGPVANKRVSVPGVSGGVDNREESAPSQSAAGLDGCRHASSQTGRRVVPCGPRFVNPSRWISGGTMVSMRHSVTG